MVPQRMTADVLPHGLPSLSTLLCLTFVILFGVSGAAQDEIAADTIVTAPQVTPVTALIVEDHKYDDGDRAHLNWKLSSDDSVGGSLIGYQVYRIAGQAEPEQIADLLPGVMPHPTG